MSAADHYATDLTDKQWAIPERLLPEQHWHPGGAGRPPCDLRPIHQRPFSRSIRPAVSGVCCQGISTPGIRFMAISGVGVAGGWGRVGWSTCVICRPVTKSDCPSHRPVLSLVQASRRPRQILRSVLTATNESKGASALWWLIPGTCVAAVVTAAHVDDRASA
jgi:hypothetical protein